MKRHIIPLFMSLAFSAVLLAPTAVLAYDPFSTICSNTAVGSSALCSSSRGTTNPLTGTNGIIRLIANIIATFTGLIAVIIIMVSGMRFITAGGDPSKVKGARESLIAALVGLIIIALADTIIGFVMSKI
jgi:Type IV secretion system pilin